MRLEFTKDLSKEEVEQLEQLWKESTAIRELLIKIIETKLVQVISNEDGLHNYDNPNFAFLVADSKGYRRGLKYTLDLLRQRVSAE